MDFKQGDKVMVYDVALEWGQAVGYVQGSEFTRHEWEIPVKVRGKKGVYWVHKKQVRKLKKKP